MYPDRYHIENKFIIVDKIEEITQILKNSKKYILVVPHSRKTNASIGFIIELCFPDDFPHSKILVQINCWYRFVEDQE